MRHRSEPAILAFCLTFPTLMAWLYFVAAARPDTGGPNPWTQALYALGKVAQFGTPVVWLWLTDRSRLRPGLGPAGTMAGLAFGLFTAAGMAWLYLGPLAGSSLWGDMGPRLRGKVAELGAGTPAKFAALAAFISVAHSLLEELYWRAFVHGGLRRYLPAWLATLVSSVGFAAHHVVILWVYFPDRPWTAVVPFSLCVAAGGAVWAWLYDRTGSLASPWAGHMVVDVALMAVGYDLVFG